MCKTFPSTFRSVAAVWTCLSVALLLTLTACKSDPEPAVQPSPQTTPAPPAIEPEPFGIMPDGKTEVFSYTLTNANGVRAKLITYGAALVEMHVPDRDGNLGDVTLGFDTLEGYLSDRNQHYGCTVGRVANRIANARFTLNGKTYELAANNGPNSLHGGEERPFDEVIWKATAIRTPDGPAVRFSYFSPDGEEGYPGNMLTKVTYTLTDKNELKIDYEATVDQPCPVNLTNHAYWNLGGAGAGKILDHELTLNASLYTPVNEVLIPTGRLAPVANTPLDFKSPTPIGARIEQLTDTPTKGYDHNFVLDTGGNTAGDALTLAARLRDPETGRVLEVHTTEPGIQFYSGNFLKGAVGKGGKVYEHRGALCLEAQHFPDSPNQITFPSIILKPGQTYRQTTVYRFNAW